MKWLVSILIIDPQRVRSFLYYYLLTSIPIITIYHHQVAWCSNLLKIILMKYWLIQYDSYLIQMSKKNKIWSISTAGPNQQGRPSSLIRAMLENFEMLWKNKITADNFEIVPGNFFSSKCCVIGDKMLTFLNLTPGGVKLRGRNLSGDWIREQRGLKGTTEFKVLSNYLTRVTLFRTNHVL